MPDKIVLARLEELRDSLDHVLSERIFSNAYLKSLKSDPVQNEKRTFLRNYDSVKNVSERFEREFASRLRQLRKEVQGQIDKPTPMPSPDESLAESWRNLSEISSKCSDIFHGWFEFVGGLAFRDVPFDCSHVNSELSLCDVSDCLANNCAGGYLYSGQSAPLSVYTLQQSARESDVHLIRLPVPSRSIWCSPYGLHSLGHDMVQRDDRIRNFPTELLKQLNEKFQTEHHLSHLNEFLSDAIATYWLGPGYALPTILLRFDPINAFKENEYFPAFHARSMIILRILDNMNDNGKAGKHAGFSLVEGITSKLKARWRPIINSELPDHTDITNDEKYEWIADRIWNEFQIKLPNTAMYVADEDAREVAGRLYREWKDALKSSNRDLSLATAGANNANIELSQLKVILNVGWWCRFDLLAEEHEGLPGNIEGALDKLTKEMNRLSLEALCKQPSGSRRG